MNYTENYQLPQWVASDRILMQDFNSAFASIDAGLGKADRSNLAALDLGRDLYRQTVQQRVFHGAGGDHDALWVNALTSREDAGGDGHGWNGRYGVSLGGGALPALESIRASAAEEAHISTVPTYTYQSQEAAVTFTSDGYGTLAAVTVWSWMNEHYSSVEYPYTIRCVRLDTGETVGEAGPFQSVSVTGTHLTTVQQVDFPLEAGVSYRLSFSVEEGGGFYGLAGFVLGSTRYAGNTVAPLTLSARAAGNTIVHAVQAPAYAGGAVGLVRWAGDGSVAVAVNGLTLTQVRSRETVNAEGIACTETEFQTDSLPEGTLTVTLEMTQGAGALFVYDFGLIWK